MKTRQRITNIVLLVLMLALYAVVAVAVAGCQSVTPGADYVKGDRQTFDAFAPVVARDVAAGHADTGFAYTAWQLRLDAAERAMGTTSTATKP